MTEYHPSGPEYRPMQVSMGGWSPHPYDAWANVVRVRTVSDDTPTIAGDGPDDQIDRATASWGEFQVSDYASPSSGNGRGEADAEGGTYADSSGRRHLVEIDTSRKESRTGERPVRLVRSAAVQLARHLMDACENTFHPRLGRLRADQAAELLHVLEDLEYSLTEMRSHIIGDLLHDTGTLRDD